MYMYPKEGSPLSGNGRRICNRYRTGCRMTRSSVTSSLSLGKMTDFIKKGDDPTTAYEKASGQYGRVADAVKIIDPRTDEEVK